MEAAASGVPVTDAYENEHRLTKAVRTGNRSAVVRLLNRGNSVNRPFRSVNGLLYPLIYLASALGHRDVAAVLLDHGADIDATDLQQCTALYIASQMNHLTTVRLLFHRGANINHRK